MKHKGFIDYLKMRLIRELPGRDAQLKMAPLIKGKPYRSFTPKVDSNRSAVLALLKPEDNPEDYKILLTLRSSNLEHHSGQFSFPGGRAENDESPEETALREANEEIGLKPEYAEIIGRLSDLYVPPSSSIITPIVAVQVREFEILMNTDEVEESQYVSLSWLADEQNLNIERWQLLGAESDVPLWRIHPRTPLWGATAMMLSELIWIYDEYLTD